MMKHMESGLGKDIWNDFINGSEQAFGMLYDLYSKDMYRCGFLYSAKAELIEDAIHDVFLEIYKIKHKLPRLENPKVYLFIALRNTLLKTYKTKEIFVDSEQINSLNSYVGNDTEEQLIREEEDKLRNSQLASLGQKLTQKDRQALFYRYVEDISYANIAKLMGINEQSAKNIVYRALTKMRTALKIAITILLLFISI